MFRPAFRRGSTFALFALLATGLAARTIRRTVVGMPAGAGITAAVSFHSECRFFAHHAWDVDPIGLVLARLIVDRLLPEGAPITVVVDDTLFRSTQNPGRPGYGGVVISILPNEKSRWLRMDLPRSVESRHHLPVYHVEARPEWTVGDLP